MAKVKFNSLITAINGKFGDAVFTNNRKGEPIIKQLPNRIAPLSNKQKETIERFSYLQKIGKYSKDILSLYFKDRPHYQTALNAFTKANFANTQDYDLVFGQGDLFAPLVTSTITEFNSLVSITGSFNPLVETSQIGDASDLVKPFLVRIDGEEVIELPSVLRSSASFNYNFQTPLVGRFLLVVAFENLEFHSDVKVCGSYARLI